MVNDSYIRLLHWHVLSEYNISTCTLVGYPLCSTTCRYATQLPLAETECVSVLCMVLRHFSFCLFSENPQMLAFPTHHMLTH